MSQFQQWRGSLELLFTNANNYKIQSLIIHKNFILYVVN